MLVPKREVAQVTQNYLNVLLDFETAEIVARKYLASHVEPAKR
jgi:hypothetical protein